MRRIRPATIVSSFCRATIAAPFSTANPKPKPHTKPPSDIFRGFVRNQLQSEERARKALGIWFRNYGGRCTQDDDELADEEKVNIRKVSFTPQYLDAFVTYIKPKTLGPWVRYYDDELGDEEKANIRKVSFSQEDFNAFVKNITIECGSDIEKFEIVREEFHKVLNEMMTKDDDTNDELDDATQHDRVDKLAEIAASEELNAFLTNSFTTKLMIECEPKYAKRFRRVIKKVRKKMIRHDGILEIFELVTDLMSKFDPKFEQLLCEVLEEVRENITQYDEGENDNTSKIEKLAKLGMNEGALCGFEEKLEEFVTGALLTNLRSIEKKKSYFMAYEVIEKVAKKVGNENLRKIAEEKLDALVTDSFLFETMGVQAHMPYFKYLRLGKSWSSLDALVPDSFVSETARVQTNMPQFKFLRMMKSSSGRARAAGRPEE